MKIYNQKEFDQAFGLIEDKVRSVKERCSKTCFTHCACSTQCVVGKLYKFVPAIEMIRTYKWKVKPLKYITYILLKCMELLLKNHVDVEDIYAYDRVTKPPGEKSIKL